MSMEDFPQLLIADENGKIFNVPFLEGCGMKAGHFFRFSLRELKRLPPCSQMVLLPGCYAVAVDPRSGEYIHLEENPLSAGGPCYPVAAFLAPGSTGTYSAAYLKNGQSPRCHYFHTLQ
jgi:hypothetical protein